MIALATPVASSPPTPVHRLAHCASPRSSEIHHRSSRVFSPLPRHTLSPRWGVGLGVALGVSPARSGDLNPGLPKWSPGRIYGSAWEGEAIDGSGALSADHADRASEKIRLKLATRILDRDYSGAKWLVPTRQSTDSGADSGAGCGIGHLDIQSSASTMEAVQVRLGIVELPAGTMEGAFGF